MIMSSEPLHPWTSFLNPAHKEVPPHLHPSCPISQLLSYAYLRRTHKSLTNFTTIIHE